MQIFYVFCRSFKKAGSNHSAHWKTSARVLPEHDGRVREERTHGHVCGERGSQAWFRSHLMKVDTSPKPPCLFVVAAAAAPVTPVAVEINVDAGAQRLAKHFQVAAQRGSGDPLQTRGRGGNVRGGTFLCRLLLTFKKNKNKTPLGRT